MDELIEPGARMLQETCPPAVVRDAQQGRDLAPLWATLSDSGYLDALVPEDAGGAGIDFATVGRLGFSESATLSKVRDAP